MACAHGLDYCLRGVCPQPGSQSAREHEDGDDDGDGAGDHCDDYDFALQGSSVRRKGKAMRVSEGSSRHFDSSRVVAWAREAGAEAGCPPCGSRAELADRSLTWCLVTPPAASPAERGAVHRVARAQTILLSHIVQPSPWSPIFFLCSASGDRFVEPSCTALAVVADSFVVLSSHW